MKKLIMMIGLATMFASSFAAEQEEPKLDLEPIVDYLVTPREMIRLDGEWLYASQKYTEVATNNVKGEKRTLYKYDDFNEATAKWQPKTIPEGPRTDFFRSQRHYKRDVVFTKDQANKAVFFRCEQIGNQYELFLNGQKVCHVPQTTGIEVPIDMTPFVREGTNTIYIIAKRYAGTGWWEDTLAASVGMGIRSVPYLELRDRVSIDDVQIITKVEPEKVWTAKVTVANRTSTPATVDLVASVEGEWTGNAQKVTIPANTNVVVDVVQDWSDVELWSPANPKLYYAKFSLIGGRQGVGVPTIDTLRQRFGFRELTVKGIRVYLNGSPFMMRRAGFGYGYGETIEQMKEKLKVFREQGCVGMRFFYPNGIERVARACDEFGYLMSTCPQVGWGPAFRTEKFWDIYFGVIAEQVKNLRNHPSIIVWGIGNEFGYVYGGGFNLEDQTRCKWALQKQWDAGKLVEELDPTRKWTCYGSAEMGYPQNAEGPMPIASLHYPMGATADWTRWPTTGYWFADGGGGWQGMTRRNKPHSVSEDLYHGLQDAHMGMAKLGGDAHFTVEGYAKTIHEYVSYYAEGYYTGHLFAWEPWAMNFGFKGNKYFENGRGPFYPDYLITDRIFYKNVWSGKEDTRKFYFFNQWFTHLKNATIKRVDKFNGEVVGGETKTIDIPSGERYEEEYRWIPPATKKAGTYEMTWSLTCDGKELTKRTFTYYVFPAKTEISVPKGTALIATTNSPLWNVKFSNGKFNRAKEAIATKPKQIVVDAELLLQDADLLQQFVRAGGKVLMISCKKDAWCPLEMRERLVPRLHRRNEDHMKDVMDASLWCWRGAPDDETKWKHSIGTICEDAFEKPKRDCKILFDAGFSKGLTHTPLLWLYDGKGAWLLNTTTVMRKWDSEAAAQTFTQNILNELGSFKANTLTKELVTVDMEAPYVKFLENNGIKAKPVNINKIKDSVLFVDADNKPLTEKMTKQILVFTKKGGDVILFNMAAETNSTLTSALKIGWKDWPQKMVPVPWRKTDIVKHDDGPKFVTRRHNHGIMQGICNDWLFTWDPSKMYPWAGFYIYDGYPWDLWKSVSFVMNGIILPQDGFNGEILTDEAAIAISPLNKGRILYSTLNMNAILDKYGTQFVYLTRAFLNNMGVGTTPYVSKNATFEVIDFKKQMNRTLWANPAYKDEKGWISPNPIFSESADLAYFPVNNCGWSLQARNYCPVDPFPTEAIRFNDIPFKIQNPEENNRMAALAMDKNSKDVKIMLPKAMKVKAVHFLGGHQHGCKNLEVVIGDNAPVVFNAEHDFDIPSAHWGIYTIKGNQSKLAWRGRNMKGREVRLTQWWAENKTPKKPVQSITLRVKDGNIGILGITVELEK